MKRIINVIILSLIYTSLLAAPSWYNNRVNHYNRASYIVGIGSGESYESAIAQAQSDLISQIRVDITGEMRVLEEQIGLGNSAVVDGRISIDVQSRFDFQITGMEILEHEVVRRRHFVMIGMNRQRMTHNLETELSDIWLNIENSLNSADRHLQNGQLLFTLNSYSDALNQIIEAYAKMAIYNSIANRRYNETISIRGLDNKLNNLINSIRLETVSGDYQTTRRGAELAYPVIFRATARNENGSEILLINLPVRLTYGDEREIGVGFTNNRGEFSIQPIAIPNIANNGRIIIKIDENQFAETYQNRLQRIRGEPSFITTEPQPVRVHLTVVDENGRNVQSAFNQVSRIFRENNIMIDRNAMIVARGIASVTNRHRSEWQNYFCEVEVNIEFINRGRVVGNLFGRGVMRGYEMSNTIDRAFGAIKIDTDEIRALVLKLEGN